MTYSNGLGNLQSLLGTVATNDTKRTEAPTTAPLAASSQTDQTQFSTTSGILNQSLSGPEARMPRVLALSASIAAGTYQVSSSDVAGKMIDSLLN